MSWSGEREGWVRCAHLAKSEALEILAESSKKDLEEGRKLAVPASPVASQPVFMGKVENCKLPFYKLFGLLKDPDVKADIMKVRGARGRDYAFKAESLAVELSG